MFRVGLAVDERHFEALDVHADDLLAAARASSGVLASLMPPALPATATGTWAIDRRSDRARRMRLLLIRRMRDLAG